MPMDVREEDLVFNVVVTPRTFRYLHPFVSSLIDNSRSRYRLVANGCGEKDQTRLRRYAERRPDRVVGVHVCASPKMEAHGVALDEVFDTYDDGPLFCFVDPDIKARGPFVADLLALLEQADVVTSGSVTWSADNVLPEGWPGLPGEYVRDRDGYVFGCPHLALYRREAIRVVRDRWGCGVGGSNDERVLARLEALGRRYVLYDTGKQLNILLQGEGYVLVHEDLDTLLHVGGVSHYLSMAHRDRPWYTREGPGRERWEFAGYAAAVLHSQIDELPAPAVPDDLPPETRVRAEALRDELVDLVDRYG